MQTPQQIPPAGLALGPASILIVEDEAIVALDLRLQLQELGYRVVGVADSGEAAIDSVNRYLPNLVLMDVRLQGPMDGIAAAAVIGRQHHIPLIFLTSHSDADTVQRAARTAPYGYLTKPYQIKELRAGIEVALTKARMERQLREADGWFAQTLRCVSDGVVVTYADGRVRFINPAAEALTGWALEDATGRPVDEVVQVRPAAPAPRPWGSALDLVNEVARTGRPAAQSHGVVIAARDQPDRPVDIAAGPVQEDNGKRLGAVLVLRDARPRIEQEAQLRASEALFRNAFDHAPLGMALVSFSGEFMLVNDALCSLLGLPRDELQRSHQDALTLPADQAHERQRLQELAGAGGGLVQYEKRYLRGGGQPPVWALVSVSNIQAGDQPACHLFQVHDLSDQKAAAEHLAALANERLRREASELANTAKSEFLSRVSHEMRTPLNAVMGFASLLQMQKSSPSGAIVQQYAGHIHAAGQHLLGLVTDLLDLNLVAQGKLRLETRPVALATTLDEALRLVRFDADALGVLLDLHLAAPISVLAEPQRLRQVLVNLLSNAIKYNRPGGKVRLSASALNPTTAQLVVQDDGIGMTPEQQQRLFQPFERLGAERTKTPGTGLGLVIARGLVQQMAGQLLLTSEPRVGTTVTFTLPLAPGLAAG